MMIYFLSAVLVVGGVASYLCAILQQAEINRLRKMVDANTPTESRVVYTIGKGIPQQNRRYLMTDIRFREQMDLRSREESLQLALKLEAIPKSVGGLRVLLMRAWDQGYRSCLYDPIEVPERYVTVAESSSVN